MIPTMDRSTSYAIRVTLTNGGHTTEWTIARDVAHALAIVRTMYAHDSHVAAIAYAGVNQTIERR